MSLQPVEFRAEPDIEPDSVRVARLLLRKTSRRVGLLPCPAGLDAASAARSIGESLVELTGGTVVIVEAAGTTLARDGDLSTPELPLSGRWIGPSLAVVSPGRRPSVGEAVRSVSAVLTRLGDRAEYAIVDLSKLTDFAERLAVARHLGSACIVAKTRASKEDDLMSIVQELEPDQLLGVVLVGD